MRRKQFSVEKIIGMLREADALLAGGKKVADVCRHLEVSESTYFRWRAEYEGVEPDQARRLRELEQENARLKRLVADQALDLSMLREVARGNF